jgi:hypothetical protein
MEVLRRFIPPASVSAFHVYYPDPWWKERHRKRRVFTHAFIADLARGLVPGGELRTVTDVAEYFEEILQNIASSGLFERISLPDESWSRGGEPLTSYEAKYLHRGRRPHRAAFRRGTSAAPPPEPWISRRPPGRPLAALLERRIEEARQRRLARDIAESDSEGPSQGEDRRESGSRACPPTRSDE